MEQYTPAPPTTPRRGRRTAIAAALVAAGAIGGGVLAGTLSANAASGTQSPTAGTYGQAPQGQEGQQGQRPGGDGHGRGGDRHGSASVRSDEKVLTGDTASKVKAAALKAVPGGTVYRVETDAGDAEYEAHMTRSDGTEVTVKLDKNFTVTAVEDGMGKGDPAPAGAPKGAPGQSGSGEAPSASPSASA